MKKLIHAILAFSKPDNTPLLVELYNVMASHNDDRTQAALALEAQARGITPEQLANPTILVSTLPTILKEITQLGLTINNAWNTVQTQKAGGKIKPFSVDDTTPIMISLVPDDLTESQLQKIVATFDEIIEIASPNFCGPHVNNLIQTRSALAAKLGALIDKKEDKGVDTSNPDVAATVALLQQEEVNNAVNEEKQEEANVLITTKLASIIAEKKEAMIAYQMDTELKKYKATLQNYILQKLYKEDAKLYLKIFETLDPPGYVRKQPDKILGIAGVISGRTSHDFDGQTANELKNFAAKHLRMTKAVVNYKIIDNIQKTLHPTDTKKVLPVSTRLQNICKRYKNIEQKLENVGDIVLDRAAKGFTAFFKKIWHAITWSFTAMGKQQKVLADKTRFFSQTMDKLEKAKCPIVVDTVAPTAKKQPAV